MVMAKTPLAARPWDILMPSSSLDSLSRISTSMPSMGWPLLSVTVP